MVKVKKTDVGVVMLLSFVVIIMLMFGHTGESPSGWKDEYVVEIPDPTQETAKEKNLSSPEHDASYKPWEGLRHEEEAAMEDSDQSEYYEESGKVVVSDR